MRKNEGKVCMVDGFEGFEELASTSPSSARNAIHRRKSHNMVVSASKGRGRRGSRHHSIIILSGLAAWRTTQNHNRLVTESALTSFSFRCSSCSKPICCSLAKHLSHLMQHINRYAKRLTFPLTPFMHPSLSRCASPFIDPSSPRPT